MRCSSTYPAAQGAAVLTGTSVELAVEFRKMLVCRNARIAMLQKRRGTDHE